jgi:hypothetical protein
MMIAPDRLLMVLHSSMPSLTGAGQWWAVKLYTHWQDRTKTPYTLLVLGENSIYFGAGQELLMPWVRVQNAQA